MEELKSTVLETKEIKPEEAEELPQAPRHLDALKEQIAWVESIRSEMTDDQLNEMLERMQQAVWAFSRMQTLLLDEKLVNRYNRPKSDAKCGMDTKSTKSDGTSNVATDTSAEEVKGDTEVVSVPLEISDPGLGDKQNAK